MKGLMLKELYTTAKYCRTYFLISAIFIVMSFMNGNSFFFVIYPCLLAGMIPSTLLSYDERSKWHEYSGTLPYTRAQLVSVKYLNGLLIEIAIILLCTVSAAARMSAGGTLSAGALAAQAAQMLIVGLVVPAVSLPFMFRFGVEKGRIAYLAVCGVLAAVVAVLAYSSSNDVFEQDVKMGLALNVILLAAVVLYALSWLISVAVYKRREL